MTLSVMRLSPTAQIPTFATEGSGACDFYAHGLPPAGVILYDDSQDDEVSNLYQRHLRVGTGIAVAIPPHNIGLLNSRSSAGFHHKASLTNGIGYIDSDFRGEVVVLLSARAGGSPMVIKNGDRIAQMSIVAVTCNTVTEVESLSETKRGTGGFGSTGKSS